MAQQLEIPDLGTTFQPKLAEGWDFAHHFAAPRLEGPDLERRRAGELTERSGGPPTELLCHVTGTVVPRVTP